MRCRTRTRRAFCSVCTDGLKRSRAGCFITKKKNEEHIFSSYNFWRDSGFRRTGGLYYEYELGMHSAWSY